MTQFILDICRQIYYIYWSFSCKLIFLNQIKQQNRLKLKLEKKLSLNLNVQADFQILCTKYLVGIEVCTYLDLFDDCEVKADVPFSSKCDKPSITSEYIN